MHEQRLSKISRLTIVVEPLAVDKLSGVPDAQAVFDVLGDVDENVKVALTVNCGEFSPKTVLTTAELGSSWLVGVVIALATSGMDPHFSAATSRALSHLPFCFAGYSTTSRGSNVSLAVFMNFSGKTSTRSSMLNSSVKVTPTPRTAQTRYAILQMARPGTQARWSIYQMWRVHRVR